MAKSELQESILELAKIKDDHDHDKRHLTSYEQQLSELKAMMQGMEDLVTQLKSENQSLTNRLMMEKDRSAQQLNELNTLAEG